MANAIGFSDGKIVKIKSEVNLDVGGGNLLVDTIVESTSGSGVTIDGVLLKDNDIVIPDGSTIGSVSSPGAITIDASGNVTLTSDFTVNGTTTTVNQTNLDVSDNIIGLNRDAASNANDSGLIIERGSTGDNAAILWDESEDKFIVGTTTATPASTGDLAVTTGTLVANIEGNVTGDLTGTADAADAMSSAVTVSLSGDVSGSATFTNAGDTASITATIEASSVEGSMLNNNVISSQTEHTGAIDDTDEFLISDAGTIKKTDFSVLRDAVFADVSGDATIAAGGALTIGTGAVEYSMIDSAAIKDEDDMISDSSSHLATQQSIKAYVDSQVVGSDSQDVGAVASTGGVTAGQILIITGTSGEVTAASDNSNSYIIGVASANASAGAAVRVYKEGIIIDIGGAFSGTSPAVGDALFLGTDGQSVTVDAPTSGEVIRMGTVVTTAGKMLYKVQHIMSN